MSCSFAAWPLLNSAPSVCLAFPVFLPSPLPRNRLLILQYSAYRSLPHSLSRKSSIMPSWGQVSLLCTPQHPTAPHRHGITARKSWFIRPPVLFTVYTAPFVGNLLTSATSQSLQLILPLVGGVILISHLGTSILLSSRKVLCRV